VAGAEKAVENKETGRPAEIAVPTPPAPVADAVPTPMKAPATIPPAAESVAAAPVVAPPTAVATEAGAPVERKRRVKKPPNGLPQHLALYAQLEEAFSRWSDVAKDFMREARVAVEHAPLQPAADDAPEAPPGKGESGGRRLKEVEGRNRQLEEEVERLRRDGDASRERLSHEQHRNEELRQKLDDAVTKVEAAEREARSRADEAEELRGGLREAGDEASRLKQRLAELQAGSIEIIEVERKEARRNMAERIAEALRHDVENLRVSENQEATAEQAKFLRMVMSGMIQSLRAEGVPFPEST
jgi:hypothetical protein